MEDRIRTLCQQIVAVQDEDELDSVILELRDALHQHIEQLRERLADYPILVERRNQDNQRHSWR
jgi:DNA-binding transcriptional regulator YbjK